MVKEHWYFKFQLCLHHADFPSLVHIQFALEAVQTVMSIADGFHWFVYGYGDLGKLGEFHLANIDSPIMCSIIALISQGVYCWRIYHLSRWKSLMLIIGLVSPISWIFATVMIISNVGS